MFIKTGLTKGLSCLKYKQTLKSGKYFSNITKNMEMKGNSMIYRNVIKRNLPIRMLSYASSGIFAMCNNKTQMYSFIRENFRKNIHSSRAFSKTSKRMSQDQPSVLLPRNVIPHQFTFHGTTTANIEVKEASDFIVFHSIELGIEKVELTQNGKLFEAKTLTFDLEAQTCRLELNEKLSVGEASIKFIFNGILNDKLAGFYRSKYQVNGEDRCMATTQFEPTDARRAFPCWDEPTLKATFQLSVITEKKYNTISNMNIIETRTIDETHKYVKFDVTPIMSTYLVALVVGEFDSVSGYTKNGVQVTAYTSVGCAEQGKFALEVGLKSLQFYDDFYGIKYPLPKADLLAIPDFAAGAMENWGCITFRVVDVLIDPKNTSIARKKRVAETVSHELAHQWFGDLVTMKWWTYLWLNEGFATFMEAFCVSELFPEYEHWNDFACDNQSYAKGLDSLLSSHPVEVTVNSPQEIDEIFDSISYYKGSSVLRMLFCYLGRESFQKGIHLYLERFAYKNATTGDLWRAFEEGSGKPVTEFMNKFITQTGFPLVTITEDGNEYKCNQRRYLRQRNEEAEKVAWNIPLRATIYKSDNTTEVVELPFLNDLDPSQSDAFVKELNRIKKLGTVKLNTDQSTFCRINYPAKWWEELGKLCEKKVIPSLDRIGLISDVFALSGSGHLEITTALDFVSHFVNENNEGVIDEISSSLGGLCFLYEDQDFYPKYLEYLHRLYRPHFDRLGWDVKEGEKENVESYRADVISFLIKCEDKEVKEEAIRRSIAYIQDPEANNIPASLRGICFRAWVGSKDEKEATESFNQLREYFHKAPAQEEKLRVLGSLSALKHEKLINQLLEMSLNGEVRIQDLIYCFSIARTKYGCYPCWNFFKKNYDEIVSRLRVGTQLLPSMIDIITGSWKTLDILKEFDEFFGTKNTAGFARTLTNSKEAITTRVNRIKRDSELLKNYKF